MWGNDAKMLREVEESERVLASWWDANNVDEIKSTWPLEIITK